MFNKAKRSTSPRKEPPMPQQLQADMAKDTISTHSDHDAHGYGNDQGPLTQDRDTDFVDKFRLDPRVVRRAMGFDPNDESIKVTFVPLHNSFGLGLEPDEERSGYRPGNGVVLPMPTREDVARLSPANPFKTLLDDLMDKYEAKEAPQPPTTPYPEPTPETGIQRLERLMPHIDGVVAEARNELIQAVLKHRGMHSPHEGYAVLKEEVEELWDEIKADGGEGWDARKEALQVAAMGMRYVLDLDPV